MSPKNTVVSLARQERSGDPTRTTLEEIAREGARRMLQQALEVEVEEYLTVHRNLVDGQDHQLVVRNGHGRERDLVTGVGPLPIRQPRVRDKREEPERFTSKILPPYLRRAPSIDVLIPTQYLKDVATSDFSEALQAILGENAARLSATNIVRLKEGWKKEFEDWSQQDLSQKHYAYWWADGICFNVRLTEERPCLLILMGSLEDGKKELLAKLDGERES